MIGTQAQKTASPSPPAARKKGFTLIEMVVVIIIVAVMTAVLVPAYSRFYAKQRFDANVRDVQDVFAYAHELALDKDAPTTLTFDAQSETFAVNTTPAPPPVDQPTALPDNSGGAAALQESHIVQMDPSISVSSFNQNDTSQMEVGDTSNASGNGRGGTSVQFRPDGTSDGATILLQDRLNGYSARLTLVPGTGRMTIEDGNGR